MFTVNKLIADSLFSRTLRLTFAYIDSNETYGFDASAISGQLNYDQSY